MKRREKHSEIVLGEENLRRENLRNRKKEMCKERHRGQDRKEI